MLHAQTKAKYPNTPFISNTECTNTSLTGDMFFNILTETMSSYIYSKADSVDELQSLSLDDLSKCLSKELIQKHHDYSAIIKSLISLTNQNDGMYKKVTYSMSNSVFRIVDIHGSEHSSENFDNTKHNCNINFHTIVYSNEHGNIIDREYSNTVKWCVIPVIGFVNQTVKNNVLLVSNVRRARATNIPKPTLDEINILCPLTYMNNNMDGLISDTEKKTLVSRLAKRGYIHRSDEQNDNDNKHTRKKDVTNSSNIDNSRSVPTNLTPRNNGQLNNITFTNSVRESACLIRERLISSSKSCLIRRFKGTRLAKAYQSIDLRLRNISESLKNDNTARNIDISHGFFNYLTEDVGVTKINGVLTFLPNNVGAVMIEKEFIDSVTSMCVFVSVVVYNSALHMTIHIIK